MLVIESVLSCEPSWHVYVQIIKIKMAKKKIPKRGADLLDIGK